MKNISSLTKQMLFALALLPAWGYADIPPMVQEKTSQQVEKDVITRMYITPKRIVTRYAGSAGNLVKNENYLLSVAKKRFMPKL